MNGLTSILYNVWVFYDSLLRVRPSLWFSKLCICFRITLSSDILGS